MKVCVITYLGSGHNEYWGVAADETAARALVLRRAYVEGSHPSVIDADDDREWCFTEEAVAPSASQSEIPTVMALCEIPRLILHAGQTYRFEQRPGCEECARYAAGKECA